MNFSTPYFKQLISFLSNIEKNANHFRNVLKPLKELRQISWQPNLA